MGYEKLGCPLSSASEPSADLQDWLQTVEEGYIHVLIFKEPEERGTTNNETKRGRVKGEDDDDVIMIFDYNDDPEHVR